LPADSPAAGVGFEDLARAQQQQAKGRQLLMQGKLEASLSALCEAARLNPTHSGIAFEVARTALIARNAVTAARFAERSLALTPPDRRSKELLADALAWQGNVEAARAEWFGIHKLTAPTDKTLKTLHLGAMLEARTVSKQGDYAQAERFLRRALCFDPENVATTTQLARVLLLAGNPKAAQGWITRALALDANDAERYVLAGDIQEALGDHSTANHQYSRALELDPEHAVAKLRVQKQAL
jgi:tetratricopeptide (TPR) repeat protein